MTQNKVPVLVDGLPTMALIDTGAAVSVMSFNFKLRLGHKVMFRWNSSATFRAVSGETLSPIGVCVVSVTLGDKVFKVEFAVLASSTHDIILGIDFLRDCGATVDCGAGEILLSAFTDDSKRCQGSITVIEDVLLPPKSMKNVPVDTSASDAGTFDVLVEPVPLNCAKKNVLVPRCVLSISNGRSALWVLNYSTEPVMLPSGMWLALFEQNVNSLIASLSDQSVDLVQATHYTETNFLSMINKSLSSEKRQALVKVLAKHATVFDFAQNEEQTSIPYSRTRHVIDTGSAHPIRQKPYRVSSAERKIIAEQVEEMLKKKGHPRIM